MVSPFCFLRFLFGLQKQLIAQEQELPGRAAKREKSRLSLEQGSLGLETWHL